MKLNSIQISFLNAILLHLISTASFSLLIFEKFNASGNMKQPFDLMKVLLILPLWLISSSLLGFGGSLLILKWLHKLRPMPALSFKNTVGLLIGFTMLGSSYFLWIQSINNQSTLMAFTSAGALVAGTGLSLFFMKSSV